MGFLKTATMFAISAIILSGCSGSSGGGNTGGTGGTGSTPLDPIACPAADPAPALKSCTATQAQITGTLSFQRVPHTSGTGASLDYSNQSYQPARGISIQAWNVATNNLLDSDTTDSAGNYTFCVDSNTVNVKLRARAEMLKSGSPAWNMSVVDNTSSGALYVAETNAIALQSPINMQVASGWDASGNLIDSSRPAAPFAILDSTYDAMQKVLSACAGAAFPTLKFNWSINNVAITPENPAIGHISSSYFNGTDIYILGMKDSDTDEYDDHVIIHEWGHYFEAFFSRADSIGGQHGLGDKLDIRVAMSEGWGNAWSGIVTDDPIYKDASGTNQATGFYLNVDDNTCATNKGWYSECSIQAILYDLYDSGSDSGDTVNLGFVPMFAVLSLEQRNTLAMTSVFSFIDPLKQDNPASASAIDTLVGNQNIDAITDIYGDSQVSNDPGISTSMFPIHAAIATGQVVNVCSTSEAQNYNGIGVNRFLRFTLPATTNISIIASKTTGPTNTDPDIVLHERGTLKKAAQSTTNNQETLTYTGLPAGTYVIEVYDYNYLDTASGTSCFNVSLTAN